MVIKVTINQMIVFSYIFLGMMICFLIASGIVFVRLDVRRTWRILSGKTLRDNRRKEQIRSECITIQSVDVTELLDNKGIEQERENSAIVDIIFIHTQVVL